MHESKYESESSKIGLECDSSPSPDSSLNNTGIAYNNSFRFLHGLARYVSRMNHRY